MGTFMAAYLAVWLAVVLYVGRIGTRQVLLTRTLDALEDEIQDGNRRCDRNSRAA